MFHEIDRVLDPPKIGDNIVIAGSRRDTDRAGGPLELQIFTVETFLLEDVEPYIARMENFALRGLKNLLLHQ